LEAANLYILYYNDEELRFVNYSDFSRYSFAAVYFTSLKILNGKEHAWEQYSLSGLFCQHGICLMVV
jgi:hypothetical protein